MSGEDRISGSRAMVSTDDVWGIVSDAGMLVNLLVSVKVPSNHQWY